MAKANEKVTRRIRIRKSIRRKISGTAAIPRLSIFRSNNEIYAQVIDDVNGITLLSASSQKISKEGKTRTQVSAEVGKVLGDSAKAQGIEKIVFDRGGFLYHGRVKALADAAREAGLVF